MNVMKSKYAVILVIIFLLFGFSADGDERVKHMSISDEVEYIKGMDIAYVDPATVPDGE